MTVLLQTRVPRDLAVRFKKAAQAEGKSTYQALRELAQQYASRNGRAEFACKRYPESFALPAPRRFNAELRARIKRGHEKHN